MSTSWRTQTEAFNYVTEAGTPGQMQRWDSPTESKARGKIGDWLKKQIARETKYAPEVATRLREAQMSFDDTPFEPRGEPIRFDIDGGSITYTFRMWAEPAKAGPKGGKR